MTVNSRQEPMRRSNYYEAQYSIGGWWVTIGDDIHAAHCSKAHHAANICDAINDWLLVRARMDSAQAALLGVEADLRGAEAEIADLRRQLAEAEKDLRDLEPRS